MKNILPLLFGAALLPMAVQASTSNIVGYYEFDGKAGSNLFVPGFVEPQAFSGAITGSTATTLSFPAATLTATDYDAGPTYATHYVEITSGPNAGTPVDIASNTDAVITLAADITALGLAGTEMVTIRPHVTLRAVLADGEPYTNFTDTVTFYETNGSPTTYLWVDGTGWSSDFGTTNDGDLRPLPPATGIVLGVLADKKFTVVGDVKHDSTVVQLAGSPGVNIVGPINPLVGTGTRLDALGFQDLATFTDAVTLYNQGPLSIIDTYLPDGSGNMVDGMFAVSTDELPHTTGAIVTAPLGDTSMRMESGVPAP